LFGWFLRLAPSQGKGFLSYFANCVCDKLQNGVIWDVVKACMMGAMQQLPCTGLQLCDMTALQRTVINFGSLDPFILLFSSKPVFCSLIGSMQNYTGFARYI